MWIKRSRRKLSSSGSACLTYKFVEYQAHCHNLPQTHTLIHNLLLCCSIIYLLSSYDVVVWWSLFGNNIYSVILSSVHPDYFDFLATVQCPVCRAGVRGGLRLGSDSGGGSRLRCPQTRAQSQVVTVTVVISGQKHLISTRELCSFTAISCISHRFA